jgi:hypothetical protein
MIVKPFALFLLSTATATASSASFKKAHHMKLSAGIITTCVAVANGLRLPEDPNTNTATASFLSNGLEIHQGGSVNDLHLETRKLKTSKAGKGNKEYSRVISAVNYVINIEDQCQSEVDELEECYQNHQAGLEECVDCAWIEVLSDTADIHCDDEILAVLETKAAECDGCLSECGEQQASLLSCAVDLYCPKDEEEGI